MLPFFIIIYLISTILIGLFASRYVKNAEDLALAGRRLPLSLCTTALFATWFGAECVLASPDKFLENGILGVIEDPFGSALCLILIGLFFARPLYKMKLTTLCDFYKQKFGTMTGMTSAIFLVPSYFSWVAAQLIAIGLIINYTTGFNSTYAIIICSMVVLGYTMLGGMWAVSITDFFQTIMIVGGLVYVFVSLVLSGPLNIQQVISSAPEGFFRFFPTAESHFMVSSSAALTGTGAEPSYLAYFAAWATIGLGSIPSQDVFQRVFSARSEKTAVRSAFFSAILYLTVALLPLLIAFWGSKIYGSAALTTSHVSASGESGGIILSIVLNHTNLFVQVLFIGALLSAILSTASGAILAPATVLAENVIFPMVPVIMSEKRKMTIIRLSIFTVAIASTGIACAKSDIYELVALSSVLSLVSLFVPLVAGLFFKSTSSAGAILAMFAGTGVWFVNDFLFPDIPALITGLIASVMGMAIGTLVQKLNTIQGL